MEDTENGPAAFAECTEKALRNLARAHLVNATVIFFGSRAAGTGHRRSDFDIGYLTREGFDPASVSRLREALDDSNIIYEVDLVDLSTAAPSFRGKVLREGRVWRS